METIFQNSSGVQMEVFLRQYGKRIKNKHVIYAVTTNLAEDRYISRSTRARLGGVNIKIGKSTGNPYARLKSIQTWGPIIRCSSPSLACVFYS